MANVWDEGRWKAEETVSLDKTAFLICEQLVSALLYQRSKSGEEAAY